MDVPPADLPSVFYQDLARPQQQSQQLTYLGQQQQQHHQPSQYGQTYDRSPSGPGYSNDSMNGGPQRQTAITVAPAPPPPSTDSLKPIPRAAKTVNEYLDLDARYPDMESILTQNMSFDCKTAKEEWAPFIRTNSFQIPDSILNYYNKTQVVARMGLFAEIGRAWITVDSQLHLWNFAGGDDIQDFEPQSHNILTVKLVKPRAGVFVSQVTHLLLVATTQDITVYGVSAVPNGRSSNGRDIKVYQTGMNVPVKGICVDIIEASAKTGRIFFSGTGDNDVYELTYQEQEKWFQPRCGKVCHTQTGVIAQFAPKIPFFSSPPSAEHTEQMVIDDSRNLLYTLSSASTIRVFHMKGTNVLNLALSYPLNTTLNNVRVMLGTVPILGSNTKLVSISAITATEARRAHLIAISSTGCRLYFSAVSSEHSYASTSDTSPPTSMQVLHVRLPPDVEGYHLQNVGQYRTLAKLSTFLTKTRKAAIFAPGYFLAFTNSESEDSTDRLFLVAPDPARMIYQKDTGIQGLIETGQVVELDGKVEAVELMTQPFSASNRPQGYGNEMAVQFDQAPTEIAVLTNDGIHLFRRRRYVEILASVIKHGVTSSASFGVEAEVRQFFESYGREEACATTLAIACGVLNSAFDARATGRVTDIDLSEYGKKYFIEFSGKAKVENDFDQSSIPSLDSVKVSGRHEGIAVYVARIVRSIWKLSVIGQNKLPTGVTYHNSTTLSKLQIVQEHLQKLASFLDENKAYIDGLSGADSMMRAVSRVEEVAQQAEHRALYSMVQLLNAMIEGISFSIVLFEDRLDEIVNSLVPEIRSKVLEMTYESLFTTDLGRELARELVTAIVNRSIASGSSVDNITDSLRRRCGSFCSAEDIVTFKATENLKRAKDMFDPDSKERLLVDSERLYEQVAHTLTTDELREAVNEFQKMQFSSGAIRLALSVADASDRGKQAMGYLADGMPIDDPRALLYEKRMQCYDLVFKALDAVDAAANLTPAGPSRGTRSPLYLRDEAYAVVHQSDDEVFQSAFFDWLFDRGKGQSLVEIDTPGIILYLQRKAAVSLPHAELLWQYFARRESFYEAASVLRDLATSQFKLSLDKRIEFLSRARGLSNCFCPIGKRQAMNDLLQRIEEEMEVAGVQSDVLLRIKSDGRISEIKMRSLVEQLDGNLVPMSDLFNRYADPYGYYEVCLAIFQGADYRGNHEIRKCWIGLLDQTHKEALAKSQNAFEIVAQEFRTLGRRFALSEYIFPPDDLLPMLEKYAIEKQPQSMDMPWVPQTFLDAGINPELILRILDGMFFRDELPFRGNARKKLVKDAMFVAKKWHKEAMKGRGRSSAMGSSVVDRDGGFKKDMVLQMLESYKGVLVGVSEGPTRESLERLILDIRKY